MSEIVRLPGTAEGPNIWVGGRNNDKLSIPFWFDKIKRQTIMVSSFSCSLFYIIGGCIKFATGLNIKVGIVQKV